MTFFDSMLFSNMLRYKGFKVSCLSTPWFFKLERTFMLVNLFQELLTLEFWYRADGQSINCFSQRLTFHFLTWFRARVYIHLLISEFFLGYIWVDPLGLIYYVVSSFLVVPESDLMSPVSLSISFYLIYLFFWLKKDKEKIKTNYFSKRTQSWKCVIFLNVGVCLVINIL